MENEEGREILIFGKRIRVGGENNGSVSHENGNEKGEKRKYIKSLMPRIRWTSDLHDSFLRAVQQLGGPNKASPKQLVELMGVEGLTHPQVKSHLQRINWVMLFVSYLQENNLQLLLKFRIHVYGGVLILLRSAPSLLDGFHLTFIHP
ncbi:hypothetical protein SUGI_1431280 [Cryptomeria japonica]|uniref:Myb-like domain-containing protein n=1 Tax=Cryptomeria japonica TaxID=3369 RepID=A0AAD3NR46_CRYJA|nr:hypothetical protein SUGI_1189250 [Cryptomeria japonica]GLJ58309.1 hypothetical protein SUGI_1431280 [Cryptomeria japonica]